MGSPANFKLAYFGLLPELQAEVRKYLRQHSKKILTLEQLFAVASDAEVGLRIKKEGKDGKKGKEEGGGKGGRLAAVQGGGGGGGKKGSKGGTENSNQSVAGASPVPQIPKGQLDEKRIREMCWVCDGFGHGWYYCPKKKPGKGCARCGSLGHRLFSCPQRPHLAVQRETARLPQQTMAGMETRVMRVEGAPSNTCVLRYPLKLNNLQSSLVLDCGATVNALEATLLNQIGGTISEPANGSLYYADGRKAKVLGLAEVEVKGKGYREKLVFWVVEDLGFTGCLGRGWLESWNPGVDWKTGELTFSDGVVWKTVKDDKKDEEEGVKRLKALTRESRKEGETVWVCLAREVKDEDEGKEVERKKGEKDEEEEEFEIVKQFKDIFSPPSGVDREGRVQHRVNLRAGAKAYRKVPYRMSPVQKEALKTELEEFLQKGWIRPSMSEWATVALVVPKKDGKPRVCIDYRDLNAISEMDAYPLPKIDELLHKLAGARWFSKLDLQSGYHQIPMEEDSIPITAFRTSEPIQGCSHFEWVVMPMGLSTAPSTFQRWMDASLQGLEDFVLVYLDDVLVYSQTKEEHEQQLRRLFQKFREKKMKVKRSKCEFFKEEVGFLGHVVKDGKLRVDDDKLDKLDEWQPPLQNVKQARQLMGFLSYYRAFIANFATITAPITDTLRTSKGFHWTEEATQAVHQAKRALRDAQERYAWSPDRQDRVTTDASGVGVGAVFEQRVEGVGWVPVAFWSRKMNQAERRYSTTDQEWLAVVEAVTRQWKHWLKGRRFILRSDHSALKQLLTIKGEDFTNRQFRWFEKLRDFTFEFEYLPGPTNAAADALSRAPAYYVSALELSAEARNSRDLGWKEIKEAAEADQEYQAEVQAVEAGGSVGDLVVVDHKVLMDSTGRVIVPQSAVLRNKLILEAHEPPFCGHLGVKRTCERLAEGWKWETLKKDVEQVVKTCDICQRDHARSKKTWGPLNTIVSTFPWEVVTMDFLSGMMPSRPGGWTGCVVVCDRFSRMMHVKECSTHPTAKEAAQLFLQLVVRQHGIPNKIITDRGTQFESLLWEGVMQQLGTRTAIATTHHPQTNGLTERTNRTLISLIRKVCAHSKDKWVEALPLLEFAYNSSVHRVIGMSPFEVNQGNNPRVPAALLVPSTQPRPANPKIFAEVLQEDLKRIWEAVKKAEEADFESTKRREDQKRGKPQFKVGDEVLCERFHLRLGAGDEKGVRKQEFLFDGPFPIVRMVREDVAELGGLPKGAPTLINVQYLRKYHRDLPTEGLRQRPPPSKPLADDSDELEWEVEKIVDVRGSGRTRKYQVKWKGYPQMTWAPLKDLTGCKEAIEDFHKRTSSD